MKVLHLIDNLLPGGTQTVLCRLTRNLFQYRVSQAVVCLNRYTSHVIDRIHSSRGKVEAWPPWQYGSGIALLRLVRKIRREHIDLVQTQLPYADVLGRIAGRIAGVPVVSAIQGHKSPFELRLGRMTSRWSSAFTVNAERMRRITALGEGVRPESIRLILHGFPAGEYACGDRTAARGRLGLADGVMAIGSVGRLSPEKGQADLLEAFAEIAGRHREPRLVLVGDGPSRGALEGCIGRHGLADRVSLAGARSDVPELLAAFDLFVLPSRAEGMPNAVLEALDAGIAAVVTTVGGVPDFLQDGRDALLVRPADPQQLARAIESLIDDPERRRSLAEAGRKKVRQWPTPEDTAEAYFALYRELTAGRS